MRKIEIYRTEEDGEQRLLVTCTYNGAEVKLDGEKYFVDHLTNNGQKDRTGKRTVYPKDGETFLDTLKSNLDSPYLAAVEK